MENTTYSLTSDKKVIIVTKNGIDIPYIPVNLQNQISNLNKQKAENNARIDAAISTAQTILDEYNNLKNA
jgi:hypothetical protein